MKERCITVPGRFESLAQVADFVRSAMQDAGWDEDNTFRVQMAVDEACSNIVEHAYGEDAQGSIDVTCCIQDQGDLLVSIHDTGKAFDPASVPEPPVGADLEDLPEGGLGLYFMRKLMDVVHFSFSPQTGNTLIMVKRKDTET